MSETKSRDFNNYYRNFRKVYEIEMMIKNVILTKLERDNTSGYRDEIGFTSSLSANGTKMFLDGFNSSISSDTKETTSASKIIVEALDVKTTKSITEFSAYKLRGDRGGYIACTSC